MRNAIGAPVDLTECVLRALILQAYIVFSPAKGQIEQLREVHRSIFRGDLIDVVDHHNIHRHFPGIEFQPQLLHQFAVRDGEYLVLIQVLGKLRVNAEVVGFVQVRQVYQGSIQVSRHRLDEL